MLVKCRTCGKKIERNDAYKVSKGKVNEYYCNEQEYLDKVHAKDLHDDVYNKIFDIFGYTIENKIIYKEISALEKIYGFQRIYDVLCYHEAQLEGIMSRDFNSEYGKIRYFSVVLKNKLSEGISIEVKPKKIEVDIPDMKYKNKRQRVSLADIELEVGDFY